MIRRFVNVVAENYKTGMYSLHRLDVSKHLFYPSRLHAQMLPLVAGEQADPAAGDDKTPMVEMLTELPSPRTKWSSSHVDHFWLVSPHSNEGKILCSNKVGAAILYDADNNSTVVMPEIDVFKGSVPASISVARPGAKEDDLYIVHDVPDSLELSSNSRFEVLRFAPLNRYSNIEEWHWRSLPLPPFVNNPQYKPALISSYSVVNDGQTICLSSVAEGIGTYCFDTVSCEWSCAGEWVLPFDGRAEYIPDLKLLLGFSRRYPGHLCATSGLSDMLVDQQTMPIVWQDHIPKKWMAARVNLINLGSGKFAIAKFFKAVRDTEDEFVVLTGMQLGFGGIDDNIIQGLKMFQHKSIKYMCASNSIHSVL